MQTIFKTFHNLTAGSCPDKRFHLHFPNLFPTFQGLPPALCVPGWPAVWPPPSSSGCSTRGNTLYTIPTRWLTRSVVSLAGSGLFAGFGHLTLSCSLQEILDNSSNGIPQISYNGHATETPWLRCAAETLTQKQFADLLLSVTAEYFLHPAENRSRSQEVKGSIPSEPTPSNRNCASPSLCKPEFNPGQRAALFNTNSGGAWPRDIHWPFGDEEDER